VLPNEASTTPIAGVDVSNIAVAIEDIKVEVKEDPKQEPLEQAAPA